jgi:hypothetical protein
VNVAPAPEPPLVIPALAPEPTPTHVKARPARPVVNRSALIALLVVAAGGVLTFAYLKTSSSVVVPVTKPTSARLPASKPAVPQMASVVASKWNTNNREWLVNNKKGVAFDLRSVNRVDIWLGQSQPMLVVRCESGRLQTFVYTASALQMEAEDEKHTVRISIDDAPEVTERWADASDHDALFAPDGAAFARSLTQARTLKFGYTPHNAPSAVAEFPVSGLGDLLDTAARQCGWKK